MVECEIKILEQPATRVKFRMVVQSHRCQMKELIFGRTTQTVENYNFFPTVQVVPSTTTGRLRENTILRMSLVDVRSTPSNIMDHFHRLVDCRNSPDPVWSVEIKMGADGRAVFKEFGIVKSLEAEKVSEVTERIINRREEGGDQYARSNRWERTQINNLAEQQCRETSSSRLKLCFEAFLKDESGRIVKVCEPVLSDEILDLNNVSSGEFSVHKMSLCSDYVEGGAEVMVFTNKVNYSRSSFFADFFQLADPESGDSARVWERRVHIPDCQLHTVGQHLGGLSFNVPMYDRSTKHTPEQVDNPVPCYFQLVKANKNNTIQARSDRLLFTYNPRRLKGGKRHLADPTVQKIFSNPKLQRVDNFPTWEPNFKPTPIKFGNLQGLQAVTQPMTLVPAEPNEPSLENLFIHSPAPPGHLQLQPNNVMSPQHAQGLISPQQNVLVPPQHAQQGRSRSPAQAQQTLMSPQHAQQSVLVSPAQAQHYVSSPRPPSSLLIPSTIRSRSVSPVPVPGQMPDLSLMDDLDKLLDNIVTDGGKTRQTKQKQKEGSESSDIVAQMSKLNM